MSELYLCAGDNSPESLVHLLGSKGWDSRIESLGYGVPLVVVTEPDERLLSFTCELLLAEGLRSAGMFGRRLNTDELYLAAEWWGRLVVEAELVGRHNVFGELLVLEKTYDPRNLSIFRVAAGGTYKAPYQGSHGIGPNTGTRVQAAEIFADPRRYYGEFAAPEVGGANALFAAGLEAARERGLPEGEVLVGEPSAFGFEVDVGEHSIVGWLRRGVIAAEAAGFSLGSWDEARRLYAAYAQDFDQQKLELRAEEWRNKGYRYGVAVILRGLQDPPVVIPTGAVFQQPSMGSLMQTLGTAQSAQVMVAAGATVPLVLPAYCLNPSFSPPAGPVAPTPLFATAVSGSQTDVWDHIRTRYRRHE